MSNQCFWCPNELDSDTVFIARDEHSCAPCFGKYLAEQLSLEDSVTIGKVEQGGKTIIGRVELLEFE